LTALAFNLLFRFQGAFTLGTQQANLLVMPHRELVAHPVQSAGSNTSHQLLDLSTFGPNKPKKMP